MNLNDSFEFAIDNIVKFGDTDIFPFPIEDHMMFDNRAGAIALLNDMYHRFDYFIKNDPPQFENMLAPSGYTGFRWATQIDPIWNAFLLGLVLSMSELIENAPAIKR